jgi:predicted RNase H-like nuclease
VEPVVFATLQIYYFVAEFSVLVTFLMFVAGVDGCRAGWIAFFVEVRSVATSVDVVDVAELLSSRPDDLLCLAIDIPIGLLNGPRACDKAARKLLAQPRGTSVFAAPCRAALSATTHAAASQINRDKTGRGLSQQAFGIIPEIKQVDDAITPQCQHWAFEVHPEVCFWALNKRRPMTHNKKTKDGVAERIAVLRPLFPEIESRLTNRPPRVGADDLLDAAAAAWTALKWYRNEAECVCTPERDEKGLAVTIYY